MEPLEERSRQETRKAAHKEEEEALTKQTNSLVARRKEMRRMAKEEETALPQRPLKKGILRIVEDQILTGSEAIDPYKGRKNSDQRREGEWVQVVNRRKRTKERRPSKMNNEGDRKKEVKDGRPRNVNGEGKPNKRRPPKTAAVAIKGNSEGFSYAEAIKKAKSQIDLTKLGLTSPKMRKATNGGTIIEIAGPDGATRAEELRAKLTEVLGDQDTITRPILKGEIRLIGLDDSVTQGEVSELIAELGNCPIGEIKTGQLRRMTNGMYTMWIQCPLAVAIQVAKLGKMKVGCTVARVELLKKRPIQCYRCWQTGHTKDKCRMNTDRSGLCFRYGQPGHIARYCTRHCAELYAWLKVRTRVIV